MFYFIIIVIIDIFYAVIFTCLRCFDTVVCGQEEHTACTKFEW